MPRVACVSRNFYWVPGTLTTFDWERTDYTHTPAERHDDLTALTNLPPAKVLSSAEIETTPRGREVRLHLENTSAALAFQISAAVRTPSGGLIAPVFWSDNWIELTPGESTTLTALLPESEAGTPGHSGRGLERCAGDHHPHGCRCGTLRTRMAGTSENTRPATSASSAAELLGPGSLWHHSHPADGAHAGLRRHLQEVAWARGRRHPARHGGHALDLGQLWPDGARLSARRLGVSLCGQGNSHRLGYLTGWCLVMDYVLNPLICTIWCSRAAMNFLPGVPYIVFAVFFALFFTMLNLNGVETSARINAGMAAALGVVIVLVLAAAAHWILHLTHPTAAFFFQPFYDRATFSSAGLLARHLHRRAHLYRIRRNLHSH